MFGKTPMQTFSDSKELAKAKYVTNLFGQNTNFKMLDEAQAGSTGKQPARNSLTDGNNKAVEQDITAFTDQLFYRKCLKKSRIVRLGIGDYI